MSSGCRSAVVLCLLCWHCGTRWRAHASCGSARIPTICRSRTQRREGFENKIVELIAQDLGATCHLHLVGAAARVHSQYASAPNYAISPGNDCRGTHAPDHGSLLSFKLCLH